MKVAAWYRIDAAFKLRMSFLGANLAYEERLQRIEELLWMRDEIKNLVEGEEYEPTVQESADEDTSAEKLVRFEVGERACRQEPYGGTFTAGSGGRGESGQCAV